MNLHLPDDDIPRPPNPLDDLSNPQARRLLTLLLEEQQEKPQEPMPVVITNA